MHLIWRGHLETENRKLLHLRFIVRIKKISAICTKLFIKHILMQNFHDWKYSVFSQTNEISYKVKLSGRLKWGGKLPEVQWLWPAWHQELCSALSVAQCCFLASRGHGIRSAWRPVPSRAPRRTRGPHLQTGCWWGRAQLQEEKCKKVTDCCSYSAFFYSMLI